jgi:hypothetical protein
MWSMCVECGRTEVGASNEHNAHATPLISVLGMIPIHIDLVTSLHRYRVPVAWRPYNIHWPWGGFCDIINPRCSVISSECSPIHAPNAGCVETLQYPVALRYILWHHKPEMQCNFVARFMLLMTATFQKRASQIFFTMLRQDCPQWRSCSRHGKVADRWV